jgi:hypothetical protein
MPCGTSPSGTGPGSPVPRRPEAADLRATAGRSAPSPPHLLGQVARAPVSVTLRNDRWLRSSREIRRYARLLNIWWPSARAYRYGHSGSARYVPRLAPRCCIGPGQGDAELFTVSESFVLVLVNAYVATAMALRATLECDLPRQDLGTYQEDGEDRNHYAAFRS